MTKENEKIVIKNIWGNLRRQINIHEVWGDSIILFSKAKYFSIPMGSIAVIKLLKWLHFRLKTKFENRVQIDIKVSEFLTAFSQDTQLESGIFSNYHKFPLYEGDYDEKRLIRYIFKRYKNFTVWDQPMEKINWEIPCVYKGIPISFAHQKFGFRIYVTNELTENRAEKVSKEIQEILNKCLKLIKPEIRSAGLSALSGSEVIVLN